MGGGIRPQQARGPWVGMGSGGAGDADLTFQIFPSAMVPHTEGGCGRRVTISPPGTEPRCCYESACYSSTRSGDTTASGRFDVPITLYPGATVPTQAKVRLFYTQIDEALGGTAIDFRWWASYVHDGSSLDTENSLHFVNCVTPDQWKLKEIESQWQNIYNAPGTVNSLMMIRLRRLGQFDDFDGDFHLLKVRLQVR